VFLREGDRFLIIGDSITDAGRREDPEGMGFGYVRLFRDILWARHPELEVEVVNKGVSGDTVRLLADRWQQDVVDAEPDVVGVSIGVNDVWRQLEQPPNEEEVLLEEFETTYRRLLAEARGVLDCRLVLCEAGIIGEQPDTPHNALLVEYNACVARLASDFDAVLAPMNAAFWRVITGNPGRAWTTDGVHPLSNGHMLMALTLFDALEQVETDS